MAISTNGRLLIKELYIDLTLIKDPLDIITFYNVRNVEKLKRKIAIKFPLCFSIGLKYTC